MAVIIKLLTVTLYLLKITLHACFYGEQKPALRQKAEA